MPWIIGDGGEVIGLTVGFILIEGIKEITVFRAMSGEEIDVTGAVDEAIVGTYAVGYKVGAKVDVRKVSECDGLDVLGSLVGFAVGEKGDFDGHKVGEKVVLTDGVAVTCTADGLILGRWAVGEHDELDSFVERVGVEGSMLGLNEIGDCDGFVVGGKVVLMDGLTVTDSNVGVQSVGKAHGVSKLGIDVETCVSLIDIGTFAINSSTEELLFEGIADGVLDKVELGNEVD